MAKHSQAVDLDALDGDELLAEITRRSREADREQWRLLATFIGPVIAVTCILYLVGVLT